MMITGPNIKEIYIMVPAEIFYIPGGSGGLGAQSFVMMPGSQIIAIVKWWGSPHIARHRTRKPWGWFR